MLDNIHFGVISMKSQKQYFTVTDAAIEKGCTRDTIYKLIREGKINVIKASKRQLIADDENFRDLKLQKDRMTDIEERMKLLEEKMRNLQIEQLEEIQNILKEHTEKIRALTAKKKSEPPDPHRRDPAGPSPFFL